MNVVTIECGGTRMLNRHIRRSYLNSMSGLMSMAMPQRISHSILMELSVRRLQPYALKLYTLLDFADESSSRPEM